MSARPLHALAATVVLIAAFTTRAAMSLDYDELFTVWVASRPLRDLVRQANLDGFTPALFYALVKLVSFAGLAREDLRVLPVLFGGLAAFLGLQASERLFGSPSRVAALVLIPASAYVFTFAHELRPYSAVLACAFYFLGRLGGPVSERSDVRAAVAALAATSLSYLGAALAAVWILECRRRRPASHLILMTLLTAGLCAPGLQKAFGLAGAGVESRIVWLQSGPSLSTAFLGLASLPSHRWIEILSRMFLAALLVLAWRARARAPLGFLARGFAVFTASLIALDAAVPIGFAPRYLALSMSALLLLIVGAVPLLGRAGPMVAIALLAANGAAVYRYLTLEPPVREDWRGAMRRLESRLGSEGVLLAFPFHHAAVAAHAYAPRLRMGGGYTSRGGPLFWYDPPMTFTGYDFTGLTRLNDPRETLRRLSSASDVCVFSDEPDEAKTASVFEAFTSQGGAEPLATGDPRLRALCRPKG